jgi:hypothetical protein
MKQTKVIRVSPEFAAELSRIQTQRIKNDKDETAVGDRLLTKKILKHPDWAKIKGDLETFKLLDE